MMIDKLLNAALRSLTEARDLYMQKYREDWDADYMANKFNQAQDLIESIKEEAQYGGTDAD